MLVARNFTGHPVCIRAPAFSTSAAAARPRSQQVNTRWAKRCTGADLQCSAGHFASGHLFDEGSILNLGMALERELGVAEDRPCICVQTTCQWGSAQATNQHGGALGYDEAPVPRQF